MAFLGNLLGSKGYLKRGSCSSRSWSHRQRSDIGESLHNLVEMGYVDDPILQVRLLQEPPVELMEPPGVVVEVDFIVALELLIEVLHELVKLQVGDPVGVADVVTVPFTFLVGEPDTVVVG